MDCLICKEFLTEDPQKNLLCPNGHEEPAVFAYQNLKEITNENEFVLYLLGYIKVKKFNPFVENKPLEEIFLEMYKNIENKENLLDSIKKELYTIEELYVKAIKELSQI